MVSHATEHQVIEGKKIKKTHGATQIPNGGGSHSHIM